MHTRIEFISRLIGAVVLAAAMAIVGVQLASMFDLDPLRYGVAFGVGGGVLGAVARSLTSENRKLSSSIKTFR